MISNYRFLDPKHYIWGLTVLVVMILNVYPFIWLFAGSIWGEEGFTTENFIDAFVVFDFSGVFLNTVIFSLGTTLIGMGLGTFVAFATARTNIYGKKFIRYISILGFVSPPWINAMGYVFLLGPRAGWVNNFLDSLIGIRPFDIYTLSGMIFVSSLFTYSLVFILISKALENIDSSFEEAALVSGASKLSTVMRITLPLIKPSLITALVFSLISGFAMFAVPAILGIPSRTYVFATQLYRLMNTFPPALGASAAIAVMFTLLAVVIGVLMILYQNRVIAGKYAVVEGKGSRIKPFEINYRWLLSLVCFMIVFIALIVPYSVVLLMSFSKSIALDFSLDNLTLGNYYFLLFDFRNMWNSVENTLVIGFTAATGAVLLSAIIAYIQIRTRLFYRHFLNIIVMLTLIVPSSALVIGFVWGWIRPPFQIYGTIWLIAIAFIARYIPLATRNASDGLQQISVSLEEAAYVCGAGWLRTFFRVILPLMKPVLIGVFLIVFLSSIRDLLIPMFLGGGAARTMTMPVAAFTLWGHSQLGEAAALTILMAILTLIVFIPLEKFITARL